NAAGRDDNVVVVDTLAGSGLDARALEVELGYLVEGEIDFRAQQRALLAPQLVLEHHVKGDVHERRLVVVPGRVGNHRHGDFPARYFRIEFCNQVVGRHRATDAAADNQNVLGHGQTSFRDKPATAGHYAALCLYAYIRIDRSTAGEFRQKRQATG